MDYLMVADVIGWVGAFLLLTAYALLSFKKITGDSIYYQAMNVLAGIGLAVSSFSHQAYPLTFVNSVWSVIGIIAIFVAVKNGKNFD
jgi:uncharacterized protein with PQ loop repeat